METQIIKPRSYVSCLREGLSYPLTHFTLIARFVWPAAIIYILLSLASTLLALRLMEGYGTALIVTVSLLEFFDLLGFSFYLGHVVWQQRKLVELGYIPRVWPWQVWREMKSPMLRSLICMLIFDFLLFLALGALACGGLLGVRFFIWLSPVPLVLLFFLLPVMQHYLFSTDTFSASLETFRVRYLWRLLAIVLLSGLVMLIVLFVGALPLCLTTYIDVQSMTAAAMGDTVGLPGYFPVLRVLAVCILQFVALCTLLFVLYPQLFHWGAATAIEKERRERLSEA